MEEIEILKKLSRTIAKMEQIIKVEEILPEEPTTEIQPKKPLEFQKDAPLQECKHKSRNGNACSIRSFGPYCKKHIHLKCHAIEVQNLGLESNYDHIKQKNREYQRRFQEKKKIKAIPEVPPEQEDERVGMIEDVPEPPIN